MKINELLVNIKNKNFNIEKELQIKTYLSMLEKKDIAKQIIDECTTNEYGAIRLDSVQQYLSYVKHMILKHTNLEYTDDDYDILCQTAYLDSTLLNEIMSCFGADAEECSRILNLMLDDYMRENSIESSIGKFLNGLNYTIDNFAASLSNFNVDSILPEDMDVEKFNTFLNKYMK